MSLITNTLEKFEESALKMEADIRAKGLRPNISYSVTRSLYRKASFYISVQGSDINGDEPVNIFKTYVITEYSSRMLQDVEKELTEQLSTL